MKILVIGLGTIGTIYGCLFHQAGHSVEHLIREGSASEGIDRLALNVLDGRLDPKGVRYRGEYEVARRSDATDYDLVFASVPCGAISGVAAELDGLGIRAPLLLACGTWEDRASVEASLRGRSYVLGYPVAGGGIAHGVLSCCVFDHFMLDRPERSGLDRQAYSAVERLFADCGIELEKPHDMIEWIWLHMAINAAVVSVAGAHGDIADTSASAERLMGSTGLLAEAVRAIRETARIVESRGMDLSCYRNELLAYRLPVPMSAPIMKRMFASNALTREIMTLHGNVNDLLYVCRSVYECGKANGVEAPLFYACFDSIASRI